MPENDKPTAVPDGEAPIDELIGEAVEDPFPTEDDEEEE